MKCSLHEHPTLCKHGVFRDSSNIDAIGPPLSLHPLLQVLCRKVSPEKKRELHRKSLDGGTVLLETLEVGIQVVMSRKWQETCRRDSSRAFGCIESSPGIVVTARTNGLLDSR